MVVMSAVGTAHRRTFIDPRLVIGLVLVAASVGGVVYLVGNAERTTPIYAAARSLVPGDLITREDLVVTQVRLADTAARYLTVEQLPAAGLILTRYIDQGELLPVSALGSTDSAAVTTVVIPLAASLPEQVDVGAVVDLWASEALDRGVFGAPAVLAGNALVTGIREADSMIAGAQNQLVEVQIPRALTARVLEAVANQSALALIPTSQPAGE